MWKVVHFIKFSFSAAFAGIFCCIAPVILFQFGLMSGIYAISFADFFYKEDGSIGIGAVLLRLIAFIILVIGIVKFNKKEKVAFEKRKKDAIEYLSQVLKDLKEVFAGLDDCLNNNLREEVKCMNQLKSQYEPKEYFRILGDVTKSLKEIYSSPAKIIDGFKSKHYNNALFTQLISDTLQLDIFKAENKVRSMKNVMPDEHERMKQYIFLHAQVFRLIEYYARETKALLEGQEMILSWEKESDNSGTMSKPSGKFNCS